MLPTATDVGSRFELGVGVLASRTRVLLIAPPRDACAESLQQLIESMPPEFTQAPHAPPAPSRRAPSLPFHEVLLRVQGVLRVREKLQREAEQARNPRAPISVALPLTTARIGVASILCSN